MAKLKNKSTGSLTPEQVIRIRLRRLADKEDIFGFLSKLVTMVVVLVAMFGFVFGITPMPNREMIPKISNGDLLLYYRLDNSYKSGDVIYYIKNGRKRVGRVVAKEGDSVEITENANLMINGSNIAEQEIYYSTPRYISDVEYPIVLEKNEYFVLGDYRQEADDSRSFGPVVKDETFGKIITVIRRTGI